MLRIKNGWAIPLLLAYFMAISLFAGFIATQKRQIDDRPLVLTTIQVPK